MHCYVCEMPLLKAPGIEWYCPSLECDWYETLEPDQQHAVVDYETKRRARDGKTYVGMPQADWLKLLEKCQIDCDQAEGLWRAIRI